MVGLVCEAFKLVCHQECTTSIDLVDQAHLSFDPIGSSAPCSSDRFIPLWCSIVACSGFLAHLAMLNQEDYLLKAADLFLWLSLPWSHVNASIDLRSVLSLHAQPNILQLPDPIPNGSPYSWHRLHTMRRLSVGAREVFKATIFTLSRV